MFILQSILKCRKSGILTGLAVDAYGRGRIIGDYRRVALYGIEFLRRALARSPTSLQEKLEKGEDLEMTILTAKNRRAARCIRSNPRKWLRNMVVIFLAQLKMRKEAVHNGLYFGYLAAVKSQNGAAMSFGRVSTSYDIYIQRDLDAGLLLTEGNKLRN